MDASIHVWFGKSKYHLHASIDDVIWCILCLYFIKQVTLEEYLQINKQIFENYGIPAHILVDNRTIFNNSRNGKSSEECNAFTQYGYMCYRLAIALETSYIPQIKGRIERLFQTLQGRLVVKMRLSKIDNVDTANEILNHYLKEFNNQFVLSYIHIISVFEKNFIGIKLMKFYLLYLSVKLIMAVVLK